MLKWRASGYTIVETMIFLAVSGVILTAAILLFQGQQDKTQFDQSMRDLNSKIEQYVNDVNSGFYQGSNKYNCDLDSSNRPMLSSSGGGATGLGTNTKCIFMGKAIGVLPNATNLKVYTVLGRKDIGSASVTNLSDANLEPQNHGGTDLTETYNLLWGAKILSFQTTPISGSAPAGNLVGFYNDLSGNTSTGGAQSIIAYGYQPPDLSSSNVQCSIESTAKSPQTCPGAEIKSWILCVQSGNSKKTAILRIDASSLGVSTKLTFGACT